MYVGIDFHTSLAGILALSHERYDKGNGDSAKPDYQPRLRHKGYDVDVGNV
jgi:hypothetical protein